MGKRRNADELARLLRNADTIPRDNKTNWRRSTTGRRCRGLEIERLKLLVAEPLWASRCSMAWQKKW
jgi:hypothetical protein